MAKFIGIYAQKSIKAPAELVGRKEHRAAKKLMNEAIEDFRAQGVALRVATSMRIVTESGSTLYLE